MTRRHLLAAACLFPLLGCGPATTHLTGTVTLNDTPVEGAGVSFLSEKGDNFTAAVRPDGTYEVPALPTGKYLIAVFPYNPDGSPVEDLKKGKALADPTSKTFIPERYRDAGTSGLSCQVSGSKMTHNIPLTP